MAPILEVKDITKRFGEMTVLSGVSFGVKKGDYLRAILVSVDRVTEFATREEVDI